MGKKVAPERDRRINHEMEDHGFKIKLYNGKLYWHNERTEQRIRLKSADRWLKGKQHFSDMKRAVEYSCGVRPDEKDKQEGEEQRDAVVYVMQASGSIQE